jgi:hypothetical protein
VGLELQRAQQLAQLARRRPRMRLEDARHLHGQGGAAGHDPAAGGRLPGRAQQRERIDAGVHPEPAVLVGEQRLDVQRRDRVLAGGMAPYAVGVGEGAQRRAVARGDQGRVVAGRGQGQRKREIESEQRQQQDNGAPAQQPQGARQAPSAAYLRLHGAALRLTAAPP